MNGNHKPVLCGQTIEFLLQTYTGGGVFIDTTYGRGGHTRALLQRIDEAACVYVLDRDPEAYADAKLLAAEDSRVHPLHARFSELANQMEPVLTDMNVTGVQGAIMDLGVSSPQLDTPSRGFSFRFDADLDMRMDPSSGVRADEWLNNAAEAEIAEVLKKYGEERHHRRIARAIVDARPLRTTTDLVDAVARGLPRATPGKHDATRVFQAVRMQVNDELDEISQGLSQMFELLAPGGRLAVISFHSLEDRLVKRFFRSRSRPPQMPRRLPIRNEKTAVAGRLIAGPVRPDIVEEQGNPRARSAILRVIEKAA